MSTDEIPGLQGKRRLYGAAADKLYALVKATVLKAGKFSVFEATSSMRAAHMFTRLCEDPELEVVAMSFPWTGIKERSIP